MTTPVDSDEELDAAAQGMESEAADDEDEDEDEDADEDEDEIDAIGKAAGLVVQDGQALGGADPVDRRDAKRWENDPASADDAAIESDRTRRE